MNEHINATSKDLRQTAVTAGKINNHQNVKAARGSRAKRGGHPHRGAQGRAEDTRTQLEMLMCNFVSAKKSATHTFHNCTQ